MSGLNTLTSTGLYIASSIALQCSKGNISSELLEMYKSTKKLLSNKKLEKPEQATLYKALSSLLFLFYIITTFQNNRVNKNLLNKTLKSFEEKVDNVSKLLEKHHNLSS